MDEPKKYVNYNPSNNTLTVGKTLVPLEAKDISRVPLAVDSSDLNLTPEEATILNDTKINSKLYQASSVGKQALAEAREKATQKKPSKRS